MIGTAVYALLTQDTAVAALVGTRVFPGVAPEGTPVPRVVYAVAGGQRYHDLDGFSGLSKCRVQIDCYGHTYSEAQSLAAAVLAAAEGYVGISGGVNVCDVSLPSPALDRYEGDGHSSWHRVVQDFFFTYSE